MMMKAQTMAGAPSKSECIETTPETTEPRPLTHLDPGSGQATILQRAGAHAKYPGLQAYVTADAATQTIRVRLTAPLHLPLKVPGGQESALIGATGAAEVVVNP